MCRGVTRIRPESSRARAGAGLNTLRCSPSRPTSRSAVRATSSRENTPITASTPGSSSNSFSFCRSARQPATITPRVLPAFLRSSISLTAAYDSAREASMKAHVFTTTRSDPVGSPTSCQPSSRRRPSIRSVSTRFLGQPRLTTANVPRQVAGSIACTAGSTLEPAPQVAVAAGSTIGSVLMRGRRSACRAPRGASAGSRRRETRRARRSCA